jgi:hypothetical protein
MTMKSLGTIAVLLAMLGASSVHGQAAKEQAMIPIAVAEITERLRQHVQELTVAIGERSIHKPDGLKRTENYIADQFRAMDLAVTLEPYDFQGLPVANVVAQLEPSGHPARTYILGAHYDSVSGTVGADDNASAVAVLLETARCLAALKAQLAGNISIKFVAFTLEEPPVFGTHLMGSRVHARNVRKSQEPLDGMLCLEMVGYTCRQAGCQDYPFPLRFLNYPKEGNFIGVVGNFASRTLTRSLTRAFRENQDLPVIPLTVPLSGWLLPSVRLSDHASFWDQGFKAVMITDSAFFRNPYYHTPEDTWDKLDYTFMAELVESLVVFFHSLNG